MFNINRLFKRSQALALALAGGLFLSAAVTNPASAYIVNSGLSAIAVSPDGKTIYVGGSNRVIYQVDAASMKVTGRTWVGNQIRKLEFTADGKTLIMQDVVANLFLLDPVTLKKTKTLRQVEAYDYNPATNTLLLASDKRDFQKRKDFTTLTFTDASSGKKLASHKVEGALGALALSKDGKNVLFFTRYYKNTSEERKRPPSSMRGAERTIFRQQHDQRASDVVRINIDTGETARSKSWYSITSDSATLAITDNVSFVMPRAGGALEISNDGNLQYVDPGKDFGHGKTYVPSADAFILGNWSSIIVKKRGSDGATTYKLRRLTGVAENPLGFATRDGKTWYAATGGFRLVRFELNGGNLKIAPIF